MVSFGNFINLLIFVAPYVIPRALAFYRSIRQRPRTHIRPAPLHIQRCLNVLFVIALLSLVRTFPYFQEPNIFWQTSSRLGLTTNLIFARLSALRPLTPLDEAIKAKFENEPDRIRLLYATYGPNVIADCPFCQVGEPQSYYYYALPVILIPHLLHIIFLGIVTSSSFSGPEGNRFRTQATIAGVALASIELWMRYTYDWEENATKRNLQDTDFFFWRIQLYRNLAFALVDALFGWVLWLSSTNRWLVQQPDVIKRVTETSESLQATYQQLTILGPLRNAILRDQELREISERYWSQEPKIMEEIEREREVVDAKNLALSRIDFAKVLEKAHVWVDNVFAGFRPIPAPASQQHTKHD